MPATIPNPAKVLSNGSIKDAPLYVKCDLTSEQRALCKEWAEHVETVDVIAWVDKVGDDGDILTCKHIIGQDGYQASLTGGELSVNHRGKCLISRASSMYKSVLSLMYKDQMVLQGIWGVTARELDLDL
jgi:hypothetical protein